eukprot:CAMPEP_0183712590 /NCGR_PEP_ID=MMETSP0737-20130205/7675_1 /TAXON_ID=385413 /ORGANISM="Thalassiosira miniscula, Strain CCMP1093" /LENGTH=331 /DNA_ID=CAMNT_0025941231 /DNA_START=88 /DNA_END=1080 /DNA_ORIENTATION=+
MAAAIAIATALLCLSTALEAHALASASNDAATLSSSSSTSTSTTTSSSKILRSSRDYHLLEVVPHDTSSFTQGLTYFDGHIYEGTGLEQQSSLLQHDPSSQMKTLQKLPLTPAHLFGEGISHYYVYKTSMDGTRTKEHRLIQLTWKDKVGKIYSLPDMEPIKEFTYETVTGEGWGITFVEHTREFYVSDGSAYLMVWDADTLEEKRRIVVTFDMGEKTEQVRYINELEFVDLGSNGDGVGDTDGQCAEKDGTCSEPMFTPTMKILANVWYQDVIVSIDPITGKISKGYDMRDIYPFEQRQADGADCLNGISVTGGGVSQREVWVTGKLWPN